MSMAFDGTLVPVTGSGRGKAAAAGFPAPRAAVRINTAERYMTGASCRMDLGWAAG